MTWALPRFVAALSPHVVECRGSASGMSRNDCLGKVHGKLHGNPFDRNRNLKLNVWALPCHAAAHVVACHGQFK